MTLKDIAEKAGVSMMTVSNVINGKHKRVSPKTIEKVNALIQEYNYIPNLSARSLTARSSHIIGIIISVNDKDKLENYLENPLISTMIGIIESRLRENGYFAMIRSIKNADDIMVLFRNWNVDGIIFLFPGYEDFLSHFLDELRCPVAIFDSPQKNSSLINVTSNDQKGLYLSTKYMINHGHAHIAFVADYEGNPLLMTRFKGYLQALEESGIPFRPEYVFPYSPTYEGGIGAGKEIASLKTKISAVVTTADICAIGIMEGARLGGYRIPMDLSVAGFDNLKLCTYTTPKLTSISQHVEEKAAIAIDLLLEKIRTGAISTSSHVVMDVEIVERQSVVMLE